MEAIDSLKSGKAPGPDGYSAKFYKVFKKEIANILCKTLNKVKSEGKPASWNSAEVVLIPKEGKDKTKVKNYRPIALLNQDYKIYTWILGKRLKELLAGIIHKDQNGFLPKVE